MRQAAGRYHLKPPQSSPKHRLLSSSVDAFQTRIRSILFFGEAQSTGAQILRTTTSLVKTPTFEFNLWTHSGYKFARFYSSLILAFGSFNPTIAKTCFVDDLDILWPEIPSFENANIEKPLYLYVFSKLTSASRAVGFKALTLDSKMVPERAPSFPKNGRPTVAVPGRASSYLPAPLQIRT
jgi:hypothetical protein